MKKSRFYNQFSKEQINKGYEFMLLELKNENAPQWLCVLLKNAWLDFENELFSYDGATFVRERSNDTLFEVSAFIHDWLNGMGIVSYEADALMLRIMTILKYKKRFIIWRWLWTRLTIVNIWRHKIKRTYKGKFAIELIQITLKNK